MFAYIILESLAEAGVKVGLPRDVATLLTAQTMKGSTSVVRLRISISGQDHLRKQKSDRRRDDPHGLGRGCGVGRGLGVAFGLAVGVGLGVELGVTVGVELGVALGVGVGLTVEVGVGVTAAVAVAVAVGVGVGVPAGTPMFRRITTAL